ncbi:carbon-nitrogen hydrolase family protein [Halorussus pelagicus]|uniref:carbon-nitrogen hydrolase family protein n=1 Tax=Halorussus pelagicus TaxID=2505977 RepID=UPI0034A2293F
MAVADLDVAANLATIEERVAALPPEVDVALFPEYALTGFVADERVREVALARDGETLERLRAVAAETDTALLVGFVERAEASGADAGEASDAGEAYYNATAYLDPHGEGEAVGERGRPVETTIYRKRHLWANESEVLVPGDERVTVETPVGTAALLTCYDLNFVGESAAFATPDVDALFVGGAWPAAHSQNWKLLLRARALDGVRWVVGAGRTGQSTVGDPTEYAGRSRVVRPDGSVQAGLNRGERDLVARLDPAVLAECREFIPVLED